MCQSTVEPAKASTAGSELKDKDRSIWGPVSPAANQPDDVLLSCRIGRRIKQKRSVKSCMRFAANARRDVERRADMVSRDIGLGRSPGDDEVDMEHRARPASDTLQDPCNQLRHGVEMIHCAPARNQEAGGCQMMQQMKSVTRFQIVYLATRNSEDSMIY